MQCSRPPVTPFCPTVRILLPFWRGVPERCFYQEFHRGITEALLELGHEPVTLPFADCGKVALEEANALYVQLDSAAPDAMLDLACWGYALSRLTVPTKDGGREPIFDAFEVACAGLLFDQPFNQAINGIVAKRLCAVYPDAGHPEQVRLIYPKIRLASETIAPPAVRPENDRSAGHAGRDIDVLYVGNVAPESLSRFWHDRTNRRWPTGFSPQFCDALVEAVLAEPERSLHLGVRAALLNLGAVPEDFDFGVHLRCVEHHLRQIFRHDAVRALAGSGVRMRVVGKGWSSMPLPGNVECGAETDYDGFFELAGRARICLDASTYLDGANDRVFSYAVNGAVCLTNASGYLRGALSDETGFIFYSMRDLAGLADRARSLLASPAMLQEAGARARAAVLTSHTWRHRVTDILGAMGLA